MLLAFFLVLFSFSGCEEMLVQKTTVTFVVNDKSGKYSTFNFRVIERVADRSGTWNITNVATKKMDGYSYTFENVKAGDYAGLIGTIGDTYKEFSLSSGDQVTLTYTNNATPITIGNSYSGYYSTSVDSWSCRVTTE